jgi:hypothetical protein
MSDHPVEGTEHRNGKRSANEIRPSAEDLEDAPASKRHKLTVTRHVPIYVEEANHIQIFWSRIFIALVPEAYNRDRFEMPSSPPSVDRITSPLICVSIDMHTRPLISTIKTKIKAEHGTTRLFI